MTIAKLGLVSCAVALLIASPVHADQSPQPTDVAGAPRLVVDAPPNGAVVQHAAIIRFQQPSEAVAEVSESEPHGIIYCELAV